MIMNHGKVGLNPNIQTGLMLEKSINVIHSTILLKEKKYMSFQ
jgi:hypothetical protein